MKFKLGDRVIVMSDVRTKDGTRVLARAGTRATVTGPGDAVSDIVPDGNRRRQVKYVPNHKLWLEVESQ
jgi:hypothetical protein